MCVVCVQKAPSGAGEGIFCGALGGWKGRAVLPGAGGQLVWDRFWRGRGACVVGGLAAGLPSSAEVGNGALGAHPTPCPSGE